VTKLSDETLNVPAAAPVQSQKVQAVGHDVASKQFNGMHGYRNTSTRAVQPREQGKIRRPGLQDHIAGAFERMSASRKSQPTEAVRHEGEEFNLEAQTPVSTVAYTQPSGGTSRASGAFKRQRVASKRSKQNARPERFDDYEELLVRPEGAVSEEPYYVAQEDRRPTSQWVSDESGYEGESLAPVAFATDYQRPVSNVHDEWGSDRIDEEIMPTTRLAAMQERNPVRPPRVAQAARSYSRQGRSKSTRGKQVSVLTRTRQGSDTRQGSGTKADGDFNEIPNRLRSKPVQDFDPLNDDLDDDFSNDEDLDDLDRDIDEELKRLRDRSDDEDLDDEEGDDTTSRPEEKDCATFRNELLNSSIRDIALDVSPPASSLPGSNYPISRSWTDQSGNVIATGAMQDFRRGYVILDSGQKIAYARLSESDLAAVSESWRMPKVCTLGNRGQVDRNWVPQTFTWTASNLCHKTLFFENVQLERYGHSHGPFAQPLHSAAHFFVSFFTVPYQAAIHPANECNYALGFYRPGNCAPWLKDPIPISLDGAKRQALVVTGLSFIP